jgi:hypothetical protein
MIAVLRVQLYVHQLLKLFTLAEVCSTMAYESERIDYLENVMNLNGEGEQKGR